MTQLQDRRRRVHQQQMQQLWLLHHLQLVCKPSSRQVQQLLLAGQHNGQNGCKVQPHSACNDKTPMQRQNAKTLLLCSLGSQRLLLPLHLQHTLQMLGA